MYLVYLAVDEMIMNSIISTFQNIAENVIGSLMHVAPYAIGIVAVQMAWYFALRFFKDLSADKAINDKYVGNLDSFSSSNDSFGASSVGFRDDDFDFDDGHDPADSDCAGGW